MTKVHLNVNGQEHDLDVDARTPLVYVLRNDLGLQGPKLGCGGTMPTISYASVGLYRSSNIVGCGGTQLP